LHTASSVCIAHLTASAKSPFRARATRPLLLLPPRSWPLEGALKLAGGLLHALGELWFGHGLLSPWRPLHCEGGTAQAGHLRISYLNDYLHASLSSAIAFSGAVDLAAPALGLPPGSQHAALAMALGLDGLLFGLHGQHSPLHGLLHRLIAGGFAAAAVLAAAEAARPASVVLAFGRGFALQVTGAWFIVVGGAMFGGDPAWDDAGDMAPVMFAPILFAWTVLCLAAANVGLFAATRALLARCGGGDRPARARTHARTPPPPHACPSPRPPLHLPSAAAARAGTRCRNLSAWPHRR
jgi:hypothetical protein